MIARFCVTGVLAQEGQCRTFGLQFDSEAGEPLWQRVEAWLAQQPSGWQLPPLALPQVRYIQGHPGWHPRGLAS